MKVLHSSFHLQLNGHTLSFIHRLDNFFKSSPGTGELSSQTRTSRQIFTKTQGFTLETEGLVQIGSLLPTRLFRVSISFV